MPTSSLIFVMEPVNTTHAIISFDEGAAICTSNNSNREESKARSGCEHDDDADVREEAPWEEIWQLLVDKLEARKEHPQTRKEDDTPSENPPPRRWVSDVMPFRTME